MIQARGLGRRFGEVRALSGLNLEVAAGEAVALLGTNGSGRTTLLKLLATLMRPSSGELRIDGIDAVREPLRARRRIGYAGPLPALPSRLTAAEYLEFTAAARGLDGERRRRVSAAALRLAEVAPESPIGSLSEGLRQRLALAGALLSQPRVVLLDGGLSRLDQRARRSYVAALRERREEGAAMVIAANSLEGLEGLCGRVALLHEGRLVTLSPLDEFEGALRALCRLAGESAEAPGQPPGIG